MSHLLCVCGADLNDVLMPCAHKFWITSDRALDAALDIAAPVVDPLAFDVALELRELWVCSACGSIGIDDAGTFRWFRPAEPGRATLDWLK